MGMHSDAAGCRAVGSMNSRSEHTGTESRIAEPPRQGRGVGRHIPPSRGSQAHTAPSQAHTALHCTAYCISTAHSQRARTRPHPVAHGDCHGARGQRQRAKAKKGQRVRAAGQHCVLCTLSRTLAADKALLRDWRPRAVNSRRRDLRIACSPAPRPISAVQRKK